VKKILYIILFLALFLQLHSKNGWYKQNSGTNKFLYDVCFVDSLSGWVVGDGGLILRTTDGGENWIEQDANVGSWLLSISFIDDLNGWIAGDNGRIRKTTDAGGRWSIKDADMYLNEFINSICFVNKSLGWATGTLGIIHTENGGDNWYFQDSANHTVSKSIFFINETVGWACGANGTIIKTVDGGKTWQKLETGSNGTFYDIFFLDLSIGWALSRHEPKILRTTNGGKDWFPQLNPINGFFTSIQFVDKKNGWAAGQDGIINSTDGGQTWKVQVPESRYNLWGMRLINKNIGWAVGGDGTILKTDNGGIKFDVDFKANVITGDAPFSTTFTDLSEGNPSQWNWDFGDGGKHTTPHPVYIYQKPGTYNVTLTVSDGIDSDSKTKYGYIFVKGVNELKADFIADTTEGEAPLIVNFTDASIGNPDTWDWDFGNGATHKSQNPINVYQTSGTYTVSLKVKRANEESTETKVNYIKVFEPISVKDNNLRFKIFEPTPNPTNEEIHIDFEIESMSFITVKIYDILGKEVTCLYDGSPSSARQSIKWNIQNQNLPGGIYLCKFSIFTEKSVYSIIKKIIYLTN